MFHNHQWVEENRAYTPLNPALTNIKCGDEVGLLREAMFGITAIVLRCDTCGDKKGVTVPGMVSRPQAKGVIS